MDQTEQSKNFAQRTLLSILAAALFAIGFLNFGWSNVSIARGWASSYKLQCTKLIVGSECNGYIDRQGGGMCSYHTPFYTLSSESDIRASHDVQVYMPVTTCDTSVDVLTPVIDLGLARIIAVGLMAVGVALGIVAVMLTRKR